MKNLSRIKIGAALVLIISGLAGLALITSCGTGEGTRSSSSSSGKDPGSSSGGDDDEKTLDCSTLSSKGDPCEDSKKCSQTWCKNALELSGNTLNECKDLGEDTVEDLVKLFDNVIEDPTLSDLNDLDSEDLELVCGAVKTLGKRILEQKVDNYNATEAKDFLAWMAEKSEVMDIFRTIEEVEEDGDEEALKMIKDLLEKIGTGSGDAAIFSGLQADDLGEDGDKHFLAIAQDNNNSALIKYIHDKLIKNDEELCDDENHPAAISGLTGAASRDDEEKACVLGVYCSIAQPSAEDDSSEEFREAVSQIVSVNFNKLVSNTLARGGLELDERDAEDWTNKACNCLVDFWEDKAGGINVVADAGTAADCPN